MKDIGPNRHLGKLMGGAVAAVSALPLYLGLQSLTFLPRDQWDWAIYPLGVAALILGLGAWLWRLPPVNSGRLVFNDQGFRIETTQVFRGSKARDLKWSDIVEIVRFDGGLYGGKTIYIYYGDEHEFITLAASWTDVTGYQIVERLAASAEGAGFTLEKEAGFWRGLLRTRWIVREVQ